MLNNKEYLVFTDSTLDLAKSTRIVISPNHDQILMVNLETYEWSKVSLALYRVIERLRNSSVRDAIEWASREYSAPPIAVMRSIEFLQNRGILEIVDSRAL